MHNKPTHRTYSVFNPDVFESLSGNEFDPTYWQQLDAISGTEKGRGTTWFITHQHHNLVLRHYYRGGLVGKLVHDRYVFTRPERCRSLHEFEVLRALSTMGLPAPIPVAARALAKGLTYRADLITLRIDNATDLIRVLQESQPNEFFSSLAKTVARFHTLGVHHADLNIKNIMQDATGQFWLIDFDRAQLNCFSQAKQSGSIARLKRSIDKERERHGIQFSEANWQVFLESYRSAKQ